MQQAQTQTTAVNATRNMSEDAILADLMREMEVETEAPAIVKTKVVDGKEESITIPKNWPFPKTAEKTAAPKKAESKKAEVKVKEPKKKDPSKKVAVQPEELKKEVVQEPEKPKVDPILRNPWAKKSQKIMAKLGDKAADYLILEKADQALSSKELEFKRAALLAELDKTAKKVGEKAVMLFGWVRDGGKMNECMLRAFKVLAQHGELTGGKAGNLHNNYLSKPYSPDTALAQGNQIFQLFPALKLTVREKGRMIPNPDSVLLDTIMRKLNLTMKAQ